MTTALPRTPFLRLDGKRALVTGAGRGLGVACAAALGQAGAHVIAAARTAAEIEDVASAIRAEGGSAEARVIDVHDPGDAIAACGPVDILVNNAGTNRPAGFLDVTTEDYDAIMDLNLRAAFFVAQAGRGGSIIHMSSQMGQVGGARRTVYCASKHAIEGLTKAMALDLAPHSIRVNSICPTYVETPLTRPYFEDPAFRADVLTRIKLGRLGRVEDLMGAVVFLASDAATLMTGTSVVIDGGWTAD